MAYDGGRGRVILFGGAVEGVGDSDEVWAWDGVAWELQNPLAGPVARSGHAMVFAEQVKGCLVFGGFTASTETWTLGKLPLRKLKTRCRDGRFVLKVTVVSDLPEGSHLTLLLDEANHRTVIVNDQGKGRTSWAGISEGEHTVCVEGCRRFCEVVGCSP